MIITNFLNELKNTEVQLEISELHEAIIDRLNIYTNALYGGRGLFDASSEVDRSEWKAYVDSLEVQRHYPGIQGFGYSKWLDPEDLDEHIAKIKAEGFSDYRVHPWGQRENYTAIIYLEPFDERNQQAFGYDMYQQPIRNKAMSIAKDTGQVAMSGKVTLVQEIDEDVQAGFLIYVPVYKKNVPLNTVEERRAAIEGFVYSPFRMNNFIEGAIDNDTYINIEIFDGSSLMNLSDDRRMYGKSIEGDVDFKLTKLIEFGAHHWTIRYSGDNKVGTFNFLIDNTPYFMLLTGFILSILISLLIYGMGVRQISAIKMAEKMTGRLRQRTDENEYIKKKLKVANADLEKKASQLTKKINQMEKIHHHLVDREVRMIELKEQAKRNKNKHS